MSDEQIPPDGGEGPQERPPHVPESQEIRFSQVGAIVPERAARGVFSTGAVVLQGAHEFIVDFLLRMTKPHQVVARVVMPPEVVRRFVAALGENLKNYERTFGALPPIPQQRKPPSDDSGQPGTSSVIVEPGSPARPAEAPPSAQELYDQLKLPDDVLSGTYANAVMIGHTATEFSFDFITTFFPRSAVACRVFLSAPNARRLLDSLSHSYDQFQRKHRAGGDPPPEPTP